MKKVILKAGILIWCLIAALPAYSYTEDAAGKYPPQLDGTMMPYDFSTTDTVVPWGQDMHPVFINYVARHGARFLSSQKKVDDIRNRLLEAKEHDRITPEGNDFLSLLDRVDSVTAGRWGALNECGIEEEQRLGKEMASIAPELLKNGKVEAESTYVPRVVMTMYEFCHSLADYSHDLEIVTAEGKKFNPLLRYFTTDKDYVQYLDNGPWCFAFAAYAREILPVRPAAAMIHETIDSHELQKITLDAYAVLQSLDAAGIEADPSEWFTEEEFAACWKVTNLKHYYQRSASTFSDLPARCARPLLDTLVSNADNAFAAASGSEASDAGDGQRVKAKLLFGHAETVIPLFALMKLPGCYAPKCMPEQVAQQWKDWEISPLGANLMMVCLQDDAGNPYVALRLNGRWLQINGTTVTNWNLFKEYLR